MPAAATSVCFKRHLASHEADGASSGRREIPIDAGDIVIY